MAITEADIKIYESEKMNDDTDAGGRITATAITCGAMNNIFPNISRIDRLEGDTAFRKVFPKVIDQTTPPATYSGCHIIVQDPPSDPNVSIVLFDNGTVDNLLDSGTASMFDFFEAYFNADISAGTAQLEFAASIGSYSLTFKLGEWDRWLTYVYLYNGSISATWSGTSEAWTLNVSAGDVIVVNGEFLQVQKVEQLSQVVSETVSRRKGSRYAVLYLVSPTQALHSIGETVLKTALNNAWKCYGTTTLSEAVLIGAVELPVVSEKVRVMPTINIPSTVTGYFPIPEPEVVDGITVGVAPDTWTLDGIEQPTITDWEAADLGQTVYAHSAKYSPVLASSLVIRIRYQGQWKTVTDDGVGGLQGFGTGTINYTSGLISMNFVGSPDEGTHILISYLLEIGYIEEDHEIIGAAGSFPVTLTFPHQNLKGGSIRISYEIADTRVVSIFDNGVGILKYFKDFTLAEANFSDSLTEWGWSTDSGQFWGHAPIYVHNNIFFLANGGLGSYGLWSCDDGINWASNTTIAKTTGLNYLYGMAQCEVNDVQIVFGEEGTTAPNSVVGFRSGITGALTFSTMGSNQEVIYAGVCAGGYFIHIGYDGTTIDLEVSAVSTLDAGGATYIDGVGSTGWMGAVGTDENGDESVMFVDVTGQVHYCVGPNYQTPSNWVESGVVTSGTPTSIVCDTSTNSWMLVTSSGGIYVSEDAGETWSVNLGPNLLNDVPAWTGASDYIVSVVSNQDGAFIVGNSSDLGRSILAITNDNGATWTGQSIAIGAWTGWNMRVYSMAVNVSSGIFCFVHRGAAPSTYEEAGRFTFDSFADLPADAGTVNVVAGTGTLTAGEPPALPVSADYYLRELAITDYSVLIESGLPIDGNTFAITGQKTSDSSDLSVQETGLALVGDLGADNLIPGPNFWESQINKEHGYALIRFSDPVIPHSIQIGVQGSVLFHPQYDEYDTDRLPTDGLVPGFEMGDTVIISDGYKVPYDNLAGGNFAEGDVIVGAIGSQVWTVRSDDNAGATGTLYLKNKVGIVDLVDGEEMDNGSGVTADVASVGGVIYNYDAAIVTVVSKNKISIAVEDGITHDYGIGTLVSNAYVPDDLVASAGTYFSEQTWPGWFDTQQGSPADGTWDTVNYPAEVTNNGAITERWRITIDAISQPGTEVTVTGESIGIVLTGWNIHNDGPVAPASLLTDPYFSIPVAAWSADGTHQVNNEYRFNTAGTEVPLWILRTVNARTSVTTVDSATLEIRGDIA